MVYMGSKSRIAKYIVPIIQSYVKDVYIEPFVGGANVIDKIQCPIRIGYDSNKYLIALWQNRERVTFLPDTLYREEYSKVRDSKDAYAAWYVGAVGFFASYNGRFFTGGYGISEKSGRNRWLERKHNFLAQDVSGVKFKWSDYREANIPDGCTVYCDPPYKSTQKYSDAFDSNAFWSWASSLAQRCTVLVSELTCPLDNVELLWQGKIDHRVGDSAPKQVTERLWRIV